MKKVISLIAYFILITNLLGAQTSLSSYHVFNKIPVEGDGGWDCLTSDETTGRLFISHGTMVQVLDEKTGKILGAVSGLIGVHAIALAPDFNKGFITDGKDSSVIVFNLQTYAVIEKVTVTGRNPDAVLYDPFSHRVFVFNGGSANATVLDANTNRVTGTISLEGRPEFAVTTETGKVYVNIEDKSKVGIINLVTMKVEQQWTVDPGEEPSGLAIDRERNRLFIVCGNKIMVIMDALNGKIISTLPIGSRVDGVEFDPVKKRAYSSNGDGTLTVVQEVNENSFHVMENVVTQKGARTIALDSKTHHVFLPTAEYGSTPQPSTENPRPRPSIKPGTFTILDIEPVK